MEISLSIIVLVILALVFLTSRKRKAHQLAFIEKYRFNSTISKKVRQLYPHLTDDDINLVFSGLRDYFYICNMSENRMVAMPSQVVDIAWHEFILFTRSYQEFCDKAIGRFLHHTPSEAMNSRTSAQQGIKRAWRLACAKEKINPANPNRLPLLFSIDGKLNIEDGFEYSPNCEDKSSPGYRGGHCAGHIGCTSGCAGDSGDSSSSGGFFDGFGDSSDSGGCGGCGGD